MKDHDREVFYKYVTASTAKAILQTKTIRWACPYTFNDPFDTQTEIQAEFFNNGNFIEHFIDVLVPLVYGKDMPTFAHEGTLGFAAMIPMLRKIRDKLPKEKFIVDMTEVLNEGRESALESLRNSNKDWHKYISNSRVLCVTENHDNLLMWAHYAEDHKGLVIELKCLPEHDTALCAAKQINYVDDMPTFTSEEEFIKSNIGLIQLAKNKSFSDLAFTKSNHWSYEKEWRCFTLSHENRTDDTNSFDTEPIFAEEVNSVYLGCKMLDDDKKDILKVLEEGCFQHVNIFEAIPNKNLFKLDFKQIR